MKDNFQIAQIARRIKTLTKYLDLTIAAVQCFVSDSVEKAEIFQDVSSIKHHQK